MSFESAKSDPSPRGVMKEDDVQRGGGGDLHHDEQVRRASSSWFQVTQVIVSLPFYWFSAILLESLVCGDCNQAAADVVLSVQS